MKPLIAIPLLLICCSCFHRLAPIRESIASKSGSSDLPYPTCTLPTWIDTTVFYAAWGGEQWILVVRKSDELFGAITCPKQIGDPAILMIYRGTGGFDYWFLVDESGKIIKVLQG